MGIVLLVRHGETDGNRKKILQVPELPLNENGLLQAAKAGKRIAAEYKVGRILTSDLQRTIDTAQAIVKETGIEAELSPLLQERNFGDLRGQAFADIMEKGISPFKEGYCPPNGESNEMFRKRTDQAWAYILEELKTVPKDRVLVVVTHGLVLNNIAKKHLQIPESDKKVPLIAFKNTSITAVAVTGEHNPYPFHHGIYNDDTHLSTVDRDPDFASMMSRV